MGGIIADYLRVPSTNRISSQLFLAAKLDWTTWAPGFINVNNTYRCYFPYFTGKASKTRTSQFAQGHTAEVVGLGFEPGLSASTLSSSCSLCYVFPRPE